MGVILGQLQLKEIETAQLNTTAVLHLVQDDIETAQLLYYSTLPKTQRRGVVYAIAYR